MTVEQLQNALKAKPFRPFRLCLPDGEIVPVTHPEWAIFSPSKRTITIYEPDDTAHILDLLLISEILMPGESLQPQTAA